MTDSMFDTVGRGSQVLCICRAGGGQGGRASKGAGAGGSDHGGHTSTPVLRVAESGQIRWKGSTRRTDIPSETTQGIPREVTETEMTDPLKTGISILSS